MVKNLINVFMFQVHAVQCNVRDPASVEAAVSQLVNDVGLPDVGLGLHLNSSDVIT